MQACSPGHMTTILCDRMQSLHMANAGEPKFYHYCYICNTQLNSCKQALLHCSGKRHRKKLQFLQARKANIAGAALGAPPAMAPAATDTTGLMFSAPGAPTFHYTSTDPSGQILTHASSGVPSAIVPAPSGYYPVIGHSTGYEWYQQQSLVYPAVAALPSGPPGPTAIMGAPQVSAYPAATAMSYGYGSSCSSLGMSSSSSPMVLTDFSYGSGSSAYSGGPRSAVISPSETSSISSESAVTKVYQCEVCLRQFVTTAQLHSHLLQTKHHQTKGLLPNGTDTSRAQRTEVTSSDAESSWDSSSYCLACKVSVGSKALFLAHHSDCASGHRHKPRFFSQNRSKSCSSSTSSEPAGEIVMDSGYGSGEELVCVSQPTADRPTAKYHCQLCNIFLNSPQQARQHISSQKHKLRVSGKPGLRRKVLGSYRKQRHQSTSSAQQPMGDQAGPSTSSTHSCSLHGTADDEGDEDDPESEVSGGEGQDTDNVDECTPPDEVPICSMLCSDIDSSAAGAALPAVTSIDS